MVVNRKKERKNERERGEGVSDRVSETDMVWSCIKVSDGDILIVDMCVQLMEGT